jgi:hypothetical protein
MSLLPRVLVVSLVAISMTACSGFLPNAQRGKVVSPQYLAQYRNGGSLSTIWYLGSDHTYHYFSHYVKVSTTYRVRRSELSIPDEFPRGSKEPVFVSDAPYWRTL